MQVALRKVLASATKNVFNKCKSQACESLFQLSSPGALGSEISTCYLVPLVVEKVGQPKMCLTLAPECILGIARRIGEDATCKHIVNPLLKKLYKPILLSKVGNKRYRGVDGNYRNAQAANESCTQG